MDSESYVSENARTLNGLFFANKQISSIFGKRLQVFKWNNENGNLNAASGERLLSCVCASLPIL